MEGVQSKCSLGGHYFVLCINSVIIYLFVYLFIKLTASYGDPLIYLERVQRPSIHVIKLQKALLNMDMRMHKLVVDLDKVDIC